MFYPFISCNIKNIIKLSQKTFFYSRKFFWQPCCCIFLEVKNIWFFPSLQEVKFPSVEVNWGKVKAIWTSHCIAARWRHLHWAIAVHHGTALKKMCLFQMGMAWSISSKTFNFDVNYRKISSLNHFSWVLIL